MPPSGHSFAAILACVSRTKSNISDLVSETTIDKKYPSVRAGAEQELKNLRAAQTAGQLVGPDRGFVQSAIDDYEIFLKKLDEHGDDVAKATDATLAEVHQRAAALHVPTSN